MNLKIRPTPWTTIQDFVQENITKNNIIVDSFLEAHIIESQHYLILKEEEQVGYFSIFNKTKLVTFFMKPYVSQMSQDIFQKIKKYEQVTHAMLPTSDEYFLSHCIDNYAKLTKQAYFSLSTDKAFKEGHFHELEMHPVETEADVKALDFVGDFYSNEDKKKILEQLDYYKVFIVKHENQVIGSGIIEYGRVDKRIASIGMFVSEDQRCKGYARSILKHLQRKVESEGYIARSGCWYYNHNSKKSMESAGFYSKTRLLNFEF